MEHGKSIKNDAKDSVHPTRQFNMDAAKTAAPVNCDVRHPSWP